MPNRKKFGNVLSHEIPLILGALMSILLSLVNTTLPFIYLLATLFTFTIVQGQKLPASVAFPAIVIFQILAGQLRRVGRFTKSVINVPYTTLHVLILGVQESQAH
jgi:hypothetical protein